MTIKVQIVGDRTTAQVSPSGELAVSPVRYSDTKFVELAVNDVIYNFYPPLPGKQFVITGITAKADKGVSSTVDAIVVIYEASTEDTATVDKILHSDAMVEGDRINLKPNIIVNEGKFINATSSDTDIHMSIFGFYIDKLT